MLKSNKLYCKICGIIEPTKHKLSDEVFELIKVGELVEVENVLLNSYGEVINVYINTSVEIECLPTDIFKIKLFKEVL